MACYYVVISSTHLRDGQLRRFKGVFRGPIGARGTRSEVETVSNLYCELCNKQYERQQQFDNHTSSYDHHHRQRLKELKQREFLRLLGSRRQRKGREHSLQRERGAAHSIAGVGPMFRSTTVPLDGSEDDPEVLTNYTKEPVASQVESITQSPACNLGDTKCSHRNTPTDGSHRFPLNAQPSTASSETTGRSRPLLWSETRVRPVCFSLPRRCSSLCHQSAAVFLQTSKERITLTADDVDPAHSFSDTVTDPISEAIVGLGTSHEKSQDSPDCPKNSYVHRPKEPFCRVLSRDNATVLLWPSEMVSYTRTSPSVSFSVNPLLHNFRAADTSTEMPVDKRMELKRSEPSVIKRAGQQQRQADAQGGGGVSRHERDRGYGGGQTATAVEVVAHCKSGNFDESALNLHLTSEFESHLVVPGKKRRRKRTKKRRRGMRRRRKKKETNKHGSTRQHSQDEEPGKQSNSANTKGIRKDQAASSDHKRAKPLSHLPVSHFNRCSQLCTQVNSQASRHPAQQSVSEWGPGFRKVHSGGEACSTAISLVPGSDIEIPRSPAITSCPALSCTDVWEAHAERTQGVNDVVQENVAKKEELAGKRTFDEAFNQETSNCQNLNIPAERSITEQKNIAQTSSTAGDVAPGPERQPRKKLKTAGRCMDDRLELMCFGSELSVKGPTPQTTQDGENPTAQVVAALVKTNANTGSHFVSRCTVCVEGTSITTSSCYHGPGACRATESSSSGCRRSRIEERQNAASEKMNDDWRLTVPNAKNQVEEPHRMTSVSNTSKDQGPVETLSCQFDCSNHLTNCNCTGKDKSEGVVNVVLISTHPEQTGEDERKHAQVLMRNERKGEDKREEGEAQMRRKTGWSERATRDWAFRPLPAPHLLHHNLLHQRLLPLSQPLPPFPPFPCHFSPPLPPLPPLLPFALYTSAPLLNGPYPMSAFPSIQSGGPSLYGPPPQALVPTQLIFLKSATFSIA